MWIKTSLIGLGLLPRRWRGPRHRPSRKVCTSAPMALGLTLAGRVIVSAITEEESMTTMPMTGGTEVAAER
jgi:hypothetical protein